MKNCVRFLALMAIIMAILSSTNLFAQWPNDASQNLLVSDQSGAQVLPKVCATSDAGCYVSWHSTPTGNYDIYLQRLDSTGAAQWQEDGILISDHPQDTWVTDFDMTVDNQDNAIITFNDIRNGVDRDIYAYKIGPDGSFLWGPDGLTISANDGFEPDPQVMVTTNNNVVFAWQEEQTENVIHLRKVSPEGIDIWSPATITISATYFLLQFQESRRRIATE